MGHGARDLCHFDGVGQAISKMIGNARREHLCFRFQAPERTRVNYALAVPLKGVAVRVFRFWVTPAPAAGKRKPEVGEQGLLALQIAQHLNGSLAGPVRRTG